MSKDVKLISCWSETIGRAIEAAIQVRNR